MTVVTFQGNEDETMDGGDMGVVTEEVITLGPKMFMLPMLELEVGQAAL